MNQPLKGLYIDEETGKNISTHSMLKTFRRCPKQTEYKYLERLKPRVLGRPLRLGTWMHALQEAKANGDDWREKHKEMIRTEWAPLFDEEKEDIGDLPGDAYRLMLSYEWYYAADEWKFHEVEFVLETEFPDGSIYRGKIDALVENQFGLWIVDRKWHRTLPNTDYRILDAQSGLYVWAAWRNNIPVNGHIWDYGRSKPPTYPEMLVSGAGPKRWDSCDTDYPTMVRWFKNEMGGKVPQKYRPKMRYLKTIRYQPGEPQFSTFFRRSVIEKDKGMLKRIAQEAYHTHRRMLEYPWDRPELIERVPDRSCTFMCSYTDLCTAELFTGGRPVNWKQRYKVGDPMDYYYDEAPTREE
jgi:hypothetical protein